MEIMLSRSDLNKAALMLAGIKNGFPKAFSRALNKTLTGTRQAMIDQIRKDYNFKAASLRRRITLKKATYSKLTASVKSEGRYFLLSDVTGTRQIKKGVSVNVEKATGRKVISRAFINHGRNIGTGQSMDNKLVFRRAEEGGRMVARYPIEARHAPFPESIYNAPKNWAKIKRSADEKLNENFSHEVDVVLKGIA